MFFSEVAFLLKTFFFVYLGLSLELISEHLIILSLVLTVIAFALRIPATRLSLRGSLPLKDMSIVAAMVPKGLAAVVLASVPLQQGVLGGELIKNLTYGVVLLSIVITSFLVMLIDKTKFYELYGWFIYPSIPDFFSRRKAQTSKTLSKSDDITPAGPKLFGKQEQDSNGN